MKDILIAFVHVFTMMARWFCTMTVVLAIGNVLAVDFTVPAGSPNAMSATRIEPGSMPRTNRLHLYALLGQPGEGMFQDDVSWQKGSFERRLMVYDADGAWRRSSGRGLEFGLWMMNSGPLHYVGLVPCAVGGSQAADWKPGSANSRSNVSRRP